MSELMRSHREIRGRKLNRKRHHCFFIFHFKKHFLCLLKTSWPRYTDPQIGRELTVFAMAYLSHLEIQRWWLATNAERCCCRIDLWSAAAPLPLLCDIIFLFISHSCICGFMGCKLIQQMEEIMHRVRELSGIEFGAKEPIFDTWRGGGWDNGWRMLLNPRWKSPVHRMCEWYGGVP